MHVDPKLHTKYNLRMTLYYNDQSPQHINDYINILLVFKFEHIIKLL